MTFFPPSLKALAILAIAALGGCGRPDTLGVDRQCCAGLRMGVPQDRFCDHDLRVADPAAGSASVVGDRESRSTHLCPDSIAGKHVTHPVIEPWHSFAD